MKVKGIKDENFGDYYKPHMLIAFPNCTFKCDKECGSVVCQNGALAQSLNIEIAIEDIVDRYMNNPITKAIVCGGLEPFDSWEDLQALIAAFRYYTPDDIVIYTGYNENELPEEWRKWLHLYACDGDIIIKFGRFIPNQKKIYDEILKVELASSNQKAVKYDDSNYDKF